MSLATIRAHVEKTLFGASLEDVLERIRNLSRSIEDISARMDRNMAELRKDLRQLENQTADVRDGLYIIEDDCISCQTCTEIAPNTFRMRPDGIAEVYNAYGSNMSLLQEAIGNCGGSCIKLT